MNDCYLKILGSINLFKKNCSLTWKSIWACPPLFRERWGRDRAQIPDQSQASYRPGTLSIGGQPNSWLFTGWLQARHTFYWWTTKLLTNHRLATGQAHFRLVDSKVILIHYSVNYSFLSRTSLPKSIHTLSYVCKIK